MNHTEVATRLACGEHMLVGVLALPEAPTDTGVVVVMGGPQYRAGSHRQTSCCRARWQPQAMR